MPAVYCCSEYPLASNAATSSAWAQDVTDPQLRRAPRYDKKKQKTLEQKWETKREHTVAQNKSNHSRSVVVVVVGIISAHT